MKNNKSHKIFFSIIFFFLFLCPFYVNALGTATTGFSGNGSVYVGNTIEITLYVGSVNGTTDDLGLAAFGGNLNYSSDKLELIGTTSLAPFNVDLVGSKFGGFGANTIKSNTNIMKFTFRAKALGMASVSYSGSSQPDASASPVTIYASSKNINITNPPSNNNNLSSLSVSNGTINFDKNNTNYTVNLDSNISNITINATAEDGGATINGLGNKQLNFGNNTFSIVVTAPSGDKKTYTVNVVRKDNRSGNNKLSSLTVSDGSLNPGFSANVESYNLEVPFSVSNLSINAKAEDSKAKVSIQNQNDLVAEETTEVKVVVTAENGSSRTYKIYVTRGKDPNKVLSTNNYLASLEISNGQLSPAFNKEQLKYVVYLPYEVESINISGTVEDTRYATIKLEGPDKLSVGSNQYKLTVTAEDNSTREYVVVVYRGESVIEKDLSSNNYLKDIKIKNGNLTSLFNKKQNVYYYTKSKKIKVEALAEDENSKVDIIENDEVFTILVEAATGDINTYSLIPKKNNNSSILITGISICVFGVGVFIGYKVCEVRNKNTDKTLNLTNKRDNKMLKKENKEDRNNKKVIED